MLESDIKLVREVAEANGWSFSTYDSYLCFEKSSPAGQDFILEFESENMDDLLLDICERYEGYDCSEEAYLWLDNSGHGRNGAPYDMKDLYEDMEACEKMILELYDALNERWQKS